MCADIDNAFHEGDGALLQYLIPSFILPGHGGDQFYLKEKRFITYIDMLGGKQTHFSV